MKTETTNTRTFLTLALALAATVPLLTGCASTKVTDRQQLVYGFLPRPEHILVYDFAASSADVPRSSDFADPSYRPPLSQSAEEIASGRQAGAQVAAELAEQIRAMGLSAMQVSPGVRPQVNDIVIRGYFVSIEEGSTAKRVTIGFGSGSSKLVTAVEGSDFLMPTDLGSLLGVGLEADKAGWRLVRGAG